jgi:transglutaminase-like putative cysteine protease
MGYCDPDNDEDAPPSLHAWAEVLVPGAGWRGLDPAARLVTNDTYVTVALGRDALDCPPIRSHVKGDTEDAATTTTTLEVTRDQ